jgi:hypothetical protein
MSELTVLQAVRLKGRVSRDDLAATLGGDFVDVVDRLVGSGLLLDGPTLRLSPAGRERLDGLLADERSHADTAAVLAAYDEFRSVNAEFKALVTDWQLQDGQPNTHEDIGLRRGGAGPSRRRAPAGDADRRRRGHAATDD